MTLTSRVSQLWRRRTPPSPRHLWAVGKATTADGATAHLQLEFTLCAEDHDLEAEALDQVAMDAVEGVLRVEVGRREVASLPAAGDAVDWLPAGLVPGARITNVFVISSDVEVTQELRRLVTSCAGP
jgi:hypothetical protein